MFFWFNENMYTPSPSKKKKKSLECKLHLLNLIKNLIF